MGSLLVFFWNSQTFINAVNEWGYKTENILLFFFAFVGFNCVLELIVTCIVTGVVGEALEKANLITKYTNSKKVIDDEPVLLEGDVPCETTADKAEATEEA